MNRKFFYGVFSTLLLFSAMFFTACTDETVVENENLNAEVDFAGLTCFTAEEPDGTRTSISRIGKFKWTTDDYIFVKDDDDVWQKSERISLVGDGSTAKFYVPGKFGRTKEITESSPYPVVYTKNWSPTSAEPNPKATIPLEQIQSFPNNSDHLGNAGDCAYAEAKKQDNGKFSFGLKHQVAYILFEPVVETAGQKVTLNRVRITEASNPRKDISGAFDLTVNGNTNFSETIVGDSVITVLCGKDVKPVETGTMKMENATNYGFLIKNADVTRYDDNDYYEDGVTPLGRIFVVIKPGEYKFKVEYEVSREDAYEQTSIHCMVYENTTTHERDTVIGKDISKYENSSDWEFVKGASYWTSVPRLYTEVQTKNTKTPSTLQANKYYRFRHTLKLPQDPPVTPGYDYQFEEYYMWGASKWFWDSGYTSSGYQYPVTHDGEGDPAEAPRELDTDERWYGYAQYGGTLPGGLNASGKHTQATKSPWGEGTVLNANQMSYYVVYGDPHYDNTTAWTLQYYRGFNNYQGEETPIVCYGGVWLKKKSVIASVHGWPVDADSPTDNANSKSAPWPNSSSSAKYNLRYNAPYSNFRTPYTNLEHFNENGVWKKPWELDPTKSKDDYFFVPCLGQIVYQGSKADANVIVPTLSLVGSQGFYWTKTPVQKNEGTTKWSVNGGNGYDNAFYLNIHYDYIALSWQQPSIYVKTGMRLATIGYGGKSGMFQ